MFVLVLLWSILSQPFFLLPLLPLLPLLLSLLLHFLHLKCHPPGVLLKLSASVTLQTAPKEDASRVPRRKRGRKLIPPLYIPVFIGRRRKKRKRRRHQRKEFYHRYYRPPRSPPILQVPLAFTAVPDKHVNRSFGSSNSLEPPDK